MSGIPIERHFHSRPGVRSRPALFAGFAAATAPRLRGTGRTEQRHTPAGVGRLRLAVERRRNWQEPPAGHGHGPIKDDPRPSVHQQRRRGANRHAANQNVSANAKDPVLKPWAAALIAGVERRGVCAAR